MTTEQAKLQFGSWYEIVKDIVVDIPEKEIPYTKIAFALKQLSDNKQTFIPEAKNVYSAFRACPLEKTRIVFLSNEPYPKAGFSDGLAFSSPSKVITLEKMFDAILDDTGKTSENTNLGRWADQGILLLNAALTTEENKLGSHVELWKPFTTKLLSLLNTVKHNVIYVSFGKAQHELVAEINPFSNFVLQVEHPVEAARGNRDWIHNNIFTKINLIIRANNLGEEIKW